MKKHHLEIVEEIRRNASFIYYRNVENYYDDTAGIIVKNLNLLEILNETTELANIATVEIRNSYIKLISILNLNNIDLFSLYLRKVSETLLKWTHQIIYKTDNSKDGFRKIKEDIQNSNIYSEQNFEFKDCIDNILKSFSELSIELHSSVSTSVINSLNEVVNVKLSPEEVNVVQRTLKVQSECILMFLHIYQPISTSGLLRLRKEISKSDYFQVNSEFRFDEISRL